MSQHRFPSSPNYHEEAGFDAASSITTEILRPTDLPTNAELEKEKVLVDQSANEHMQTIARLLYDILHEWRERHDGDSQINDQDGYRGNRKGKL